MSVRIRLARRGAKKNPFYRIVVADGQAKRDGRFLEIIGTYDPNKEPAEVRIKQDRLEDWLAKGAQPTNTVASLIRKIPAEPAAS
ncbi:MAG: 30S ribosomal protein S16 [Pseudomonadota bacterium]